MPFDTEIIQSANIGSELASIVTIQKPEKPIVILGRIGHGKSTFLKYLRLIEAQTILNDYLQIDVDFIDRPATKEEVEHYIFHTIREQLYHRYGIDVSDDATVRGALDSDLKKFHKSFIGKAYENDPLRLKEEEIRFISKILDDEHVYFTKLIHHLKFGRRKSIAIYFDNLDRRDDPIQEEAFLRASSLARDWACSVFVCLRPGTFWRSKKEGVLDSIAPRIISISSPKIGPLLKRRLEYASRMASGEIAWAEKTSAKISVHLPKVADILGCAADSFFRNAELRDLVGAFSNGDVRELLRLVRQILTSKHLDTKKILKKIRTTGYRIAAHEALRALLYGDYAHFEPDSSAVVNLFDIVRSDPLEHFTRSLALQHLFSIPQGHPTFGYTAADSLLQYLAQIGFTVEHINSTMDFLFKKACCESEIAGQSWSENPKRIRATPLGRYHIQWLINLFTYYDAVVVDTPIIDDKKRRLITDSTTIKSRLERGMTFVDYLVDCGQHIQDVGARKFELSCLDRVEREIEQIYVQVTEEGGNTSQ